METKKAVIVIKTSQRGTKASNINLSSMVSEITTHCVDKDIEIVGFVIGFSGANAIQSMVKDLKAFRKRFDYVVVYTPKQVATNRKEWERFVFEVQSASRCKVVSLYRVSRNVG